MSFSNNRMSSEFSRELSSTIDSASLLPGNSESPEEVLKDTLNENPVNLDALHINTIQ